MHKSTHKGKLQLRKKAKHFVAQKDGNETQEEEVQGK